MIKYSDSYHILISKINADEYITYGILLYKFSKYRWVAPALKFK
jgi:hypothetical protein